MWLNTCAKEGRQQEAYRAIHEGLKYFMSKLSSLETKKVTAIEPYENLLEKSAEELLMDLQQVPESIRTAVRNNAGGHVNHSMFWKIMSPKDGGQPAGKLLENIKKHFGSFEEFQSKFNDSGAKRFGSGWVWLVRNKDGALEIMSTANQDNPKSDGYFPIIGNDVWEHAYYLQYKNVRADYLKAWWNIINWQEVEKRFLMN